MKTRELNPNYWICDCGTVLMNIIEMCVQCRAVQAGRLGVDQAIINSVVKNLQESNSRRLRRLASRYQERQASDKPVPAGPNQLNLFTTTTHSSPDTS